jgi:hypothetical protein
MALVDTDPFSSSNAPNPFFRQHHEVEAPEVSARAFRPAWRVRTKLDRLALDGAITGFEWRIAKLAAQLLRARLRQRPQSTLPRRGMPGRAPYVREYEDPSARRAAAREYLVDVERTMGATVYGILLGVMVDDLSGAGLGRRLDRDPKTAKGWAIAALKALATV